MPLKSKAQFRKLLQLEKEGKISKQTLNEFIKSTPDISKLPERLKKKQK